MRPIHSDPQPASGLSRRNTLILVAATAALTVRPGVGAAATAEELAEKSRLTLDRLYATRPQTQALGQQAKAILVFPEIIKAGFLVGGQGGEGAMLANNQVVGFFNIFAASYGLQAGAQKFSYVMFFMNQKAVDYAKTSQGWSFGSGPSIVLIDEGAAKNLNTTTLRKDVYAVAFGQEGLMGGFSLEGSKISPIHPKT